MSLKLPARVSKLLVTALSAGAVAGAGLLWYQRVIMRQPVGLMRDSEGILRVRTRKDVLEREAAVR